MNCHEAREFFSAKADDLLTSEQESIVDGHLRGCPGCRGEWERFSRTLVLLHGVREARAPAGFAARVIQAADRQPWHRRLFRALSVPLHVRLPVEAAALVLVSTLAFFLYRQTPELERAVEPPTPAVTASVAPPPGESPDSERLDAKASPAPQETLPPSEAREGALRDIKEKDRPAAKQEPAPPEGPAVADRQGAEREARKSAGARSEPKLAARAQGPFHLVGRLKPRDREALDSQLSDVVKQLGGILVRDADRVRAGSIVEVVVSRDAYPRLEARLRQIGQFTVETRAQTFPERLRVALRIVE